MSMGCLSYLTNWDSSPIQLQDCFIPDMEMIIPEIDTFFFQPQPQQQLQLHQPLFQEEAPFSNHFLPPQEIFLPNPNPNPNLNTEFYTETHQLDCFLPPPKRQKLSYHCNNTHSNFQTFFDPYDLDILPESLVFPEFKVPDFSLDFKVGCGGQDESRKPLLSAQSIAARERRRRIAEKTHELGKLIPGGHKLNTAEMFQAAAKYVKFLQSQIGILQLVKTTTETRGESYKVGIETQVSLSSQAIQEKLSMEEVCLVPCEIVQAVATEESIWRNPKISREINKLLSTDLV